MNFARLDLGDTGSYGGRQSPGDPIIKQPVIFIHGNSDSAIHASSQAPGWTHSIQYFLRQGYSQAEIYATTWGDRNAANAATRVHDCATMSRLRRFVEAVIAYTNATKIDVISHSMGVTLGRQIIKGGRVTEPDGACNLGSPLSANVDTFLGLAGANYGLCSCEGGSAWISPTCSSQNGLWPGDSCGLNYLTCGLTPLIYPCANGPSSYSSFLMQLNADTTKEGDYVFSAWSLLDDLILYGDQVWGRPTSLIPRSTGHKTYNTYGHMDTKDLTAEDQYSAVVNHVLQ